MQEKQVSPDSISRFFVPLTTSKVIHFLIIIGLFVFSNMLFNSFIDDDTFQIAQNPAIRSLANIPQFFLSGYVGGMSSSYYRPLTMSVIITEYSLFTQQPFFYHLFQLSLHIGISVLVFFLFRKWFRMAISFILATLFLIHPLNVESVVYISNIQEQLFLLCGLLALHSVFLSLKKEKKYPLVAVFLLASLLAKETGVIFVLVAPLLGYLYHKREFLYGVCATGVALTLYIILRVIAHIPIVKSPIVPISTFSLTHRLLHVPKILFYYTSNFFLPNNILANQSWTIASPTWQDFFFPLLVELLIVSIFVMLFVKVSQKKTELRIPMIVFSLWLVIGVGLHLQLLPLDMTVADHWFYASSIAALGLLGIIFSFLSLKKFQITYVYAGFGIIICLFGLRTMVRNTNWKDGLTLSGHDLARVGRDDYLLEKRYGTELMLQGRKDEAVNHLEKAVHLFSQNSGTWNNLGTVYVKKGYFTKAEVAFTTAIREDDYFAAYENLAYVQLKQESNAKALSIIEKGLKYHPNDTTLWFYKVLADLRLKKQDDALGAAQKYYELSRSQQSEVIYTRLKSNLPVNISLQ